MTNITWTDETWNPIVGCSIQSAGCTNCYAMRMSHRLAKMKPGGHYDGLTKVVNGKPVWTGKVTLAPKHIVRNPTRWKKPRRIFVNSMGDLFHEDVPNEWIDQVFQIMAATPQHTYQILTKNANRAKILLKEWGELLKEQKKITEWALKNGDVISFAMLDKFGAKWPLPNVHLGVSVEDQKNAANRIPYLMKTPAAKRFISCEPLLGEIYLGNIYDGNISMDALSGEYWHPGCGSENSFSTTGNPKLDWVIAGGESGTGHRPMNMAWAKSLMQQCKEAKVPFFFKQDSGPRPGMRGRASNALWACKQQIETVEVN